MSGHVLRFLGRRRDGGCETGPGLVWCSVGPWSARREAEEPPCFLLGVIPAFSSVFLSGLLQETA